ncbi:hydroxymethylglutaryl-CoA reductase, degradative [Staphylococcus aureus subsp. aureus 21235]|uniref:hydroxymethylglutaryl-CoA reductase, degradative n=1 Tax=Staphylococcus aureus TaxID=1280 RepID=UPI00021AE652|nr:hydroxymethylglutaryl-CoA reductase, degradative [Staphylococcus aureus]EGS82726.1 hydroxymethylglutaryl-CoA reductase, degradative [Staphylococcus aureus subsp. aureus 21235]QKE59094.1 hydroxymethylglutaryl-CoA reductase, degradative [Staphylococcus aureus]SUM01556.1 3-hydroxy-3-methylglutaryl-coenzyme A reductase [Staphylococcus aureus]HCZ6538071.1 hydroxymethylglutaryl-CoA reductase, degradative [Staphylococcus aureus]HCZ6549136.1 hydroxymethylglutaryl-CoA reductase, degradative [Staphyl
MQSLDKNFRHLSRQQKLQQLIDKQWLSEEQFNILLNHPLIDEEVANSLIENVIAQGALPVGLLPNIIVDDKAYVVPMMVEEPSVVAAASYGAKLVNQTGGFKTVSSERIMIGQIVFDGVDDTEKLSADIKALEKQIHKIADEAYPSIKARGGGYQRIASDTFPEQQLLSLKVFVDTKDAMGANMLNTILEAITAFLKNEFPQSDILMSILSNHATASVVKVQGEIDVKDLARGERTGEEVAKRMERASVLAQVDIHRAATHNKGVMNGIHAVVLATGNDTRGAEASAHAYASRDGQYRGIATWRYDQKRQRLIGTIEVPMTLAIVGGGTKVLPIAKASLELLNVDSAQELGHVVAAVGLAQNFAACRALVSEGIQQGHMSLQYKSLAIVVGAKGDEIAQVAEALKQEPRANTQVAERILQDLRSQQ